MTLTAKEYESLFATSGGGANDVSSIISKVETIFDDERSGGMKYYLEHPDFGPLIFAIKQLQDEIDYLRTEISANKAKDPIPKPSNTTVTFSDMVENRGVYSIRLTASRNFGGKTGVVTKSIDLRLL